jgi:hypothetical protein
MLAREQLERHKRRTAAGRAFVLEPALQQFDLLAVAELPDRALRDRAHAIVRVACGALDLVGPFAAQVGNRPLVARDGQLVRLGRRLLEVQEREATGY